MKLIFTRPDEYGPDVEQEIPDGVEPPMVDTWVNLEGIYYRIAAAAYHQGVMTYFLSIEDGDEPDNFVVVE